MSESKAPKYKKPSLLPIEAIKFHYFLLPSTKKIRVSLLLILSIITAIYSLLSPVDFLWYISLAAFLLGILDLYSTYFLNRKL